MEEIERMCEHRLTGVVVNSQETEQLPGSNHRGIHKLEALLRFKL